MVESPTYYHSLSPVLGSLKEFDMENFPLQAEVIYAKPAQELPGYLKDATFKTSIVCSSKNTSSTAKESQGDKPEGNNSSNTLETSEEEVFEESVPVSKQSNESFNAVQRNTLETSEGEVFEESVTVSKQSNESPNADQRDSRWELLLKMFGRTTSSKADLSEDDKESSSNVHDVAVEPSCAKISNESHDTASEERLGRRMNVERFLESFNSSSESSLEASQCKALVHALKNRLAVIQGK